VENQNLIKISKFIKLPVFGIALICCGCQTLGGFGGVGAGATAGLGAGIIAAGEERDASEKSSNTPSGPMFPESDVSFALNVGSYFHRDGILREAGDIGPTLALDLNLMPKEKDDDNGLRFGWTAFWGFDHFWKTNNGVLKQKYWNKDFTNYLAGFGVILQARASKDTKISYSPGFAINFLEIDSFGPRNDDFKDQTVSITHKLKIESKLIMADDYKIGDSHFDNLYYGLSLFTYWTPSPLGKFLNTTRYKANSPANSWAWMVHLVWEYL